MATMGLSVDIRDNFTPTIRASLAAISDVKPLLRIFGVRMVGSLKKNIRDEGRPEKWKGTHGKSYTLRFSSKGKEQHGRIGRDTGHMMNSIQVQDLTGNYVAVGPGVKHALYFDQGTKAHKITARRGKSLHFFWKGDSINKKTGEIKSGIHEAFPKAVNHPGTIPRPFMLFQDSDQLFIDEETLKFIDKAFGVN